VGGNNKYYGGNIRVMGKIEINHTGSGSGITLSSDGTDLLLDGTAIGGGTALELYAENPSTPTDPSATGANSVAIGDGASSETTRSLAIGYSSRAYGGEGSLAVGYNAKSFGIGSTAIGVDSHVNGGNYAVALGRSFANGADSFAAAIGTNSSSYGATGPWGVAVGYRSKAVGQNGVAIGGTSNIASGVFSFAVGPSSNVASGMFSVAIGDACEATTNNSFAMGHDGKSVIQGKLAFGAGKFSAVGDAQSGSFVLRKTTTDATPTQLTTNNGAASTTNQIILPDDSAFAFSGTIVAREQASDGTDCAAWEIKGLIRREGSAGTTVLVNSATAVFDNTPSWGLTLSADTSNGGLKIEVTGAAATNIRWVATINTSELTY
jgi:hypothetical protein